MIGVTVGAGCQLAVNEMALGYALAGNREGSRRAFDAAMDWLAQPVREADLLLGQRSVARVGSVSARNELRRALPVLN